MRDKNIKYLVICESPNKVESLRHYISDAGYNVKVMASVGHISGIKDNHQSYFNTGIYPNEDFKMDLEITSDKWEVVTKLKAAAKTVDHVVLATDGDNEGAQISWTLIKFLDLADGTYSRLITHEITPKAVVRAFENPVPMDTGNALAAQARMTIDKMIGYRMSPIAKTYIGAKSVGRCQSAGLKLIVDRELEIRNFKPEKYYNLTLEFKKNKTEFSGPKAAKYAGTDAKAVDKIKDLATVNQIKNECTGDFIISTIEKHEKQESPKPPFSTATFQQEVASKLGLSVKDAMACAQKLFEGGFTTYLRTDDDSISPEFIPVLKTYIENNYGKKSFNKPRQGKKAENAQEGHECLRITNPDLTPEEFNKTNTNNLLQKVYKIVWQRTIAAALPNAVISETNYVIKNNQHKFNLVSNEVLDDGYRKIYSYKDDDAGEDIVVKETFKEGEVLKNCKLVELEKETKPKPRFKEATFIKELQKRGIGRPSTFASIVETVLSVNRGYCEINKKTKEMIPTDRGMQLIEFLDRSFSNIINIDWTKDMEAGLDKIATGKVSKSEFLTEFYNTLENTVKANTETVANVEEKVCPNCGAPMVVRRSRFGKLFYGCSTYPKCMGLINLK